MKRLVGLVVASIGMVAFGITPADARVTGWYDCREGNFCTWRHADASSMATSHPNHPGAPSVHYLQERDVITSFYNRGTQDAMLFDWTGTCYRLLERIGPGGWGNLPGEDNDRTDVIKFGYASSLPGAC